MSVPTMLAIPKELLFNLGLKSAENKFYQLTPEDLISQAVAKGEGVLSDTDALVIDTSEIYRKKSKRQVYSKGFINC